MIIKDKNWMIVFRLVTIYALSYLLFFFIFFFILGSNSVELVIAFSFIFLISLIYLYFADMLNDYFISVFKVMWLHFSNLLLLLILSKNLILKINKTYLFFLEYKVSILYNVNYSLDYIFSDILLYLTDKFYINNILKIFYNKLFLMQKTSDFINNQFLIDYDVDYNIELLNIYSFFFILNQNG